jgi:hypothetical protein
MWHVLRLRIAKYEPGTRNFGLVVVEARVLDLDPSMEYLQAQRNSIRHISGSKYETIECEYASKVD